MNNKNRFLLLVGLHVFGLNMTASEPHIPFIPTDSEVEVCKLTGFVTLEGREKLKSLLRAQGIPEDFLRKTKLVEALHDREVVYGSQIFCTVAHVVELYEELLVKRKRNPQKWQKALQPLLPEVATQSDKVKIIFWTIVPLYPRFASRQSKVGFDCCDDQHRGELS